MKYASQDYAANMFGRYTPASHMVKNRSRKAQEEIEAKESEGDHECGCKK